MGDNTDVDGCVVGLFTLLVWEHNPGVTETNVSCQTEQKRLEREVVLT